jgi:hypothetical protein
MRPGDHDETSQGVWNIQPVAYVVHMEDTYLSQNPLVQRNNVPHPAACYLSSSVRTQRSTEADTNASLEISIKEGNTKERHN